MLNTDPYLDIVDTTTAPQATLLAIAQHDQLLYAEHYPEDPLLNQKVQIASPPATIIAKPTTVATTRMM